MESPESLEVVIIDNASERDEFDSFSDLRENGLVPFSVTVIRNEENKGFYWPLLQVCEGATPADLVGLMHNDVFIYEKGWDRILRDYFVSDGRLGLVGLVGSDQLDDRGGRGGGTKCNFRGLKGQLQEHTGRRIDGLEPACLLDSLFMVMREPVVKCLEIDDNIAPCHFYDKLWSLKTIHAEWRVGVAGISCDHQGGRTAVEQLERFERDAAIWCLGQGISFEGNQAATQLYLEAERRFLRYARDTRSIPGRMNGWQFMGT